MQEEAQFDIWRVAVVNSRSDLVIDIEYRVLVYLVFSAQAVCLAEFPCRSVQALDLFCLRALHGVTFVHRHAVDGLEVW